MKKQKGSIIGILVLVLLSSMTLFSSYTLLTSGQMHMKSEMNRLGFGDFTVWVSDSPDELEQEIVKISDVGQVIQQPLVYCGYEIGGQYSDDEGQLLTFDGSIPYYFTHKDGRKMNTPEVERGTVYISPALSSTYNVEIGDNISFQLSRKEGIVSLQVAGYFADAFMGSSMIDMKSFLISEQDMEEIRGIITEAEEVDVLGREGAMLHISKASDSNLSDLEFYQKIQENTDISLYTDFTYREDSILNYMLLLQNILSGFMLAFSLVLLCISVVVIRHSIGGVLEQEKKDIAILKTMGLSGVGIRNLYLTLYGLVTFGGLIFGILPSKLIASILAKGMVTSTGLLVDIKVPLLQELWMFIGILILLLLFVIVRTRKIRNIAPIVTMRDKQEKTKTSHSKLRKKWLIFDLAVRELITGKNKYLSLAIISMILVVFLSIVGRMGSWLGPNGEGLMNTFSVAEHDLGVQPFNASVPMDEIERVIEWYSPIEDTYELAMQSVTLNGQEYTANILNDTEWFHILEGAVCDGNSILITDTVANEQALSIGDEVRITANGKTERYVVSGIYQCANGMGTNIGMSMAGYSKVGDITGFIWCKHYILKDGSVRDFAMQYIQEHYRGIDVHTNSWSGLDGIVSMMKLLIICIYIIAAIFIMVSVSMTSSKLIQSEIGNIAIYRSIGLSAKKLRKSFALRFMIVDLIGAMIGVIISQIIADPLISIIYKQFGIGEFRSQISILGVILPLIIVPVLFFLFSWGFSKRMAQFSVIKLISKNEKE